MNHNERGRLIYNIVGEYIRFYCEMTKTSPKKEWEGFYYQTWDLPRFTVRSFAKKQRSIRPGIWDRVVDVCEVVVNDNFYNSTMSRNIPVLELAESSNLIRILQNIGKEFVNYFEKNEYKMFLNSFHGKYAGGFTHPVIYSDTDSIVLSGLEKEDAEMKHNIFKNCQFKVKRVIFNNPLTIVLWEDGTKTMVQCRENDKYDPEKGLALCFMKKACGNNSSFNNVVKEALDEHTKMVAREERNELKKKLVSVISDIVASGGSIANINSDKLSSEMFFVAMENNIDNYTFGLLIEDRFTKGNVRWTISISNLLKLTHDQIKREMGNLIHQLEEVGK